MASLLGRLAVTSPGTARRYVAWRAAPAALATEVQPSRVITTTTKQARIGELRAVCRTVVIARHDDQIERDTRTQKQPWPRRKVVVKVPWPREVVTRRERPAQPELQVEQRPTANLIPA